MKTIITHLDLPKLFAVESAVSQIDPGLPLRATVATGFSADPSSRSRDPSGSTGTGRFPVYIRVEVPCPDDLEPAVVTALQQVARSADPDRVDIQVRDTHETNPLYAGREELTAI